jgi:hypothetical protein
LSVYWATADSVEADFAMTRPTSAGDRVRHVHFASFFPVQSDDGSPVSRMFSANKSLVASYELTVPGLSTGKLLIGERTTVMKVKVSPDSIVGDVDEGCGNWPTFIAGIWPVLRRSEPLSPSTATARKLSTCVVDHGLVV